MASGFFALLDDVATLMDDVAAMGKIAGKKTAGLLGDDLAVNAEKASGFISARELPVIWEITKGSFLNKLIILPLAFLLNAFLPSAISIILIVGGLYLAYEGAEKIYEYFVPHSNKNETPKFQKLSKQQILSLEKEKIKSAILTDFILSVEIVIIALGSIADQDDLLIQILTVSLIALIATVGVYGLVALIVRMDEFGAKLVSLNNSFSDKIGRFLISALPVVIKSLTVIGTIALLLVSGGIFTHNIHFIHDLLAGLPSLLAEFLVGLVVGFIVLLVINLASKLWKKVSAL
ncbi:DUF808 domain-containing protein [Psychroflexus sediminis]|uniref:Inner membrane protein YedI n=1 Tax=Psychroflexus sediminis TaxID=470826 RepID=A0A1G7VZP8_9FLAO|nr:DUF808 domain-containing protein [Psychroflexus sediminis]SDG64370.1 hypothetical protein SAMN04488027_104233 [Psychroflexus sediminis]